MSEDPQTTDVAIIGAGPVGIFAVFECGMVNLSCHVIDALAGRVASARPSTPKNPSTIFPVIRQSWPET